MAKKKPRQRPAPGAWDRARDELYSHILSCGVLEASLEHQKEWFDDTMDYLGERYNYLGERDLRRLRDAGEQFCRPVIGRSEQVAATK